MILYLDSSSLVKLLVAEPHSARVQEWIGACRVASTSRVAKPEVLSALARRMRDGSLRPADVRRAASFFTLMWETLLLVDLDENAAGALAFKHALRGFDAIHLAAAISSAQLGPGADLLFSSFDGRLNAAARTEGLKVLEP